MSKESRVPGFIAAFWDPDWRAKAAAEFRRRLRSGELDSDPEELARWEERAAQTVKEDNDESS